jgi:molybdopterin-guanine dinucleotide biosynthesis protein A
MSIAIPRSDITGVILAGGLARRMGGVDKGLQPFQGQTLVEHALQRLRPQVGRVGINANRSIAHYEALGVPVWPDATTDFAGPLSGFLAGMTHSDTPYLMTAPCDTPYFPHDLVARLGQALREHPADIAMAAGPEENKDGQIDVRTQPVFCLLKVSLLPHLQSFMQSGGRKIDAWTGQHPTVVVNFDRPHDDPRSFFNINTLQQLQAHDAPST